MIFIFLVTLVIFASSYFLSKNKYNEYINLINAKEYPLRALNPIGLFLLEKFKYKGNGSYSKKIQSKISQLYGSKNNRLYLKIFMANKIVSELLVLLVLSLIGSTLGNFDTGFFMFLVFVLVIIIYISDKDLKDRIENRNLMIRYDFPDVLNKLILLINAGSTVSKAMEKIVKADKTNKYLYKELEIVYLEMQAGKSEFKAYEDLAKRCKVQEVNKFCSIIIQNLRKGNEELTIMLRFLANECWSERKNIARQLGEKASTKLMLPMMIMFLAVLIIVIAPVVIQMAGL